MTELELASYLEQRVSDTAQELDRISLFQTTPSPGDLRRWADTLDAAARLVRRLRRSLDEDGEY